MRLFQHSTQVGAGDKAGVAGQPAGLDVRLGLDIGGLAGGQLFVADGQMDGRIRDVDLDGVPLFDQTDGTAGGIPCFPLPDGQDNGETSCRVSALT